MRNFHHIAKLGTFALAVSSAACVQNRPARNGVFNENQYVKKSFLIADPATKKADSGWMLRASITQVSTPNPLGDAIFLTPGLENGGSLVRFVATEDKLQLVSMRELTAVDSEQRTPEVVNAWPISHVDLKYRVNLDGENTNFFEENQELDWQTRQYVKVKFAKNDMSDVAPMGGWLNDVLNQCTDIGNATATLAPGSFVVDEKNNYMQWSTQITLPLKWDDAACVQAYGQLGAEAQKLGRNNVTFTLKYSMMRATPTDQITYKPLVVTEKDPIRHKYGFFDFTTLVRSEDTGLLAARQLAQRFDPEKPIVWYFANGFPEKYKAFFSGPGGVADQTNALFTDSGVKARVSFKNFDDPEGLAEGQAPREYGDVRYNFLVWMTDRDTQSGFAGLTQFTTDPRTGETLTASIMLNDFAIKDYYVQRIDAYLQSLGAAATDGKGGIGVNSPGDWTDPGACQDGDTMPLIPDTVAANHNASSSVYAKMQQYLQKPQSLYGNLGPADFIAQQDDDFLHAYFTMLPYLTFADPDANQFVIREGGQGVYGAGAFWDKLRKETEFQTLAASIDRGEAPYDVLGGNGLLEATSFLNKWRTLTTAHKDYNYAKAFVQGGVRRRLDAPDAFSLETVMAHDARHCINGKWETKAQWVDNLISTYWSQVAWHEFGHSLGLTHNFMASVDKNNFPTYKDGSMRDHYGLYASSVMEYNSAPDRVFWKAGWAPYDQGAISFIYANTAPTAPAMGAVAQGISGQLDINTPWKDPHGFTKDGKSEIQYLFCNENHLRYTPLCRQGDLGVTPSAIIANEIERYEWQYKWNNFRQYRKFWDNSAYANVPANLIVDMRRFMSLWIYDWGAAELADTFRRVGITNPDANGSQLEYYQQLTDKFNMEASRANQMVGAFHKAIIQQSSGERPYRTIYDKFYGDTTQQGIILDKLFAMQGWVALWPTDNYDQNQAGGYVAAYEGLGDASYNYVAEDAVLSMVGGQYDVFPYFVPLAVAQFAQDTHSPSFAGKHSVRDWIGGHTFTRLQDFLDYFRTIAVDNNFQGCLDFGSCKYDPRPLSDTHNEFLGPDHRVWIWAYIADRNQWVAVQKDRNSASYIIVRNYTDDVIYNLDDGAYPGGAYGLQLPMKYFLDAFNFYN